MQGLPQLNATGFGQKLQSPLILPVLCGILVWASFPKLNQGYLAWVALIPLILHLDRVERITSAFLGGLVAGTVQFLGLLYWIPRVLTHYGGLPAPGAWVLFVLLAAALGCFPAVACALTRFCINRCGSGFLLVFAPAWISLEYLRSKIPFGGFPWLMIGYSQTDYRSLIQIADVAGVYGVSFLVVWINIAIVWLVLRRRHDRVVCIAGAVMLMACFSYGFARLRQWDQIQPQYRAALLQENLSIDEPDSALRWKYQQGYVKMADQLGPSHIDLLILPESPSPLIYQYDQAYREALRGLARRFMLGLVFNNIYFRDDQGTTRYFNSAFFLDQSGTEVGRYDKIHLVPFGEYIPWQKFFFFSEAISKDVGSFSPGSTHLTLPLRGHRMNAIICFEAVFPDFSREFIRRGSQLIINLTNDGWYGDSSAPYQHLAMARWRAVESRRYLLRAANSGISAIVSPSGRIEVQTGLLREDTAVGGFAFLSGETFYTRHGDALPGLCAIISIFALSWSSVRGTGWPAIPAS